MRVAVDAKLACRAPGVLGPGREKGPANEEGRAEGYRSPSRREHAADSSSAAQRGRLPNRVHRLSRMGACSQKAPSLDADLRQVPAHDNRCFGQGGLLLPLAPWRSVLSAPLILLKFFFPLNPRPCLHDLWSQADPRPLKACLLGQLGPASCGQQRRGGCTTVSGVEGAGETGRVRRRMVPHPGRPAGRSIPTPWTPAERSMLHIILKAGELLLSP
jgi:hypothetical protein